MQPRVRSLTFSLCHSFKLCIMCRYMQYMLESWSITHHVTNWLRTGSTVIMLPVPVLFGYKMILHRLVLLPCAQFVSIDAKMSEIAHEISRAKLCVCERCNGVLWRVCCSVCVCEEHLESITLHSNKISQKTSHCTIGSSDSHATHANDTMYRTQ